MIRTIALGAAWLLATIAAAGGAMQTPPPLLDVDHVFVVVPPGGHDERAALEKAGITVLKEPAHHVGAGTASLGAVFANAYLELLWADPDVPANADHAAAVERTRQRAAWRRTGASPFGIGLRRTQAAPDARPVTAGKPYTAPWMRPGTSILVLGDETDLKIPGLFVVPRYMGLDAWGGDMRAKQPEVFRHRLGLERLTGVSIRTPRVPDATVSAALPAMTHFVTSPTPLLELAFDQARKRGRVDFRPVVPLVVTY